MLLPNAWLCSFEDLCVGDANFVSKGDFMADGDFAIWNKDRLHSNRLSSFLPKTGCISFSIDLL